MSKLFKILLLSFLGLSNAFATIEVVVDGKKINSTSPITLNANYHEIIFLFTNDAKYHYQFYLEGLENEWKTSTFPSIRYTNLSGGSYVFYGKVVIGNQVIATNKISIEIKENFWEKWWFWLFIVFFALLFFSFLIYFWFLYDFRQRMKTEQIRQRIAADLHDEVGANLSSITFLVGSLQKKIKGENPDLNFLLEKITDNSTESATLINDTIWVLNPSFDTFEKLFERIKSFASSLLASNDIAFTIENNLTNKQVELSIEQRRNLYLIIKEAINNIAKHSEAKKTFLKISNAKNGILIAIEDDGKGYNLKDINEGNGLRNIQKRAEDSHFDLITESEIGKGTKLHLNILTA